MCTRTHTVENYSYTNIEREYIFAIYFYKKVYKGVHF